MRMLFLVIGGLVIVSCSNRMLTTGNTSPDAPPSTVRILENDGGSFHKAAVVYDALSPNELFAAEYDYISNLYGQRGDDWFLMSQTIIRQNDKIIDVVELQGKEPSDQKVIFFDVTDVYNNKKGSAVTLIVKHN